MKWPGRYGKKTLASRSEGHPQSKVLSLTLPRGKLYFNKLFPDSMYSTILNPLIEMLEIVANVGIIYWRVIVRL